MADNFIYSDADRNLETNSNNYFVIKRDESAINDMIRNAFTIFKGEILFAPNIGNSLEELMFEYDGGDINIDEVLTDVLRDTITFIDPVVTVSRDSQNERQFNYTVEYTIKNDKNIGKVYTTSDSLT